MTNHKRPAMWRNVQWMLGLYRLAAQDRARLASGEATGRELAKWRKMKVQEV